jgi:hypothetical protein
MKQSHPQEPLTKAKSSKEPNKKPPLISLPTPQVYEDSVASVKSTRLGNIAPKEKNPLPNITNNNKNLPLLQVLLLDPLLSQLAGVLGAVTEPLALEVEDVRRDDERNGKGGEDEARDGELPFGAGADVGVERCGVQSRDTGEEVTAETVAAGGAGGVFAVGGDLEGMSVLGFLDIE